MASNIGKPPPSSEITSEELYLRRREFIKNSVFFAVTAAGVGGSLLALMGGGRHTPQAGPEGPPLPELPPRAGAGAAAAAPTPTTGAAAIPAGNVASAHPAAKAAGAKHAAPGTSGAAGAPAAPGSPPPGASPADQAAQAAASADADATAAAAAAAAINYDTTEPKTPYDAITTYNNFYEFGTGKDEPAYNAHTLRTRPWTIAIEGEVGKPQTVDIDALLRWFPLQERVYRMRCVEAWSMVVPWLGFPLGDLLKRVEPTSRAKYVAFTTLLDPEQMPEQRRSVLSWPYVEGLRMDEAMHPLTILVAGLYGKTLPGQNGAPLRLVVPWKYGFKGIKSIVKIRLTEQQPPTTWNITNSYEYGFYANVNPAVDHPRWSQASERRIGDLTRRPTLPFNGYADLVAGLYSGMDLRRDF